MIKRLLEVGIRCIRVWLLIKHNFPMHTSLYWISFGKKFLLPFFSLGEPFPDAHLGLEIMSELMFHDDVIKQVHVLKQ